jgi:hypothetical protein
MIRCVRGLGVRRSVIDVGKGRFTSGGWRRRRRRVTAGAASSRRVRFGRAAKATQGYGNPRRVTGIHAGLRESTQGYGWTASTQGGDGPDQDGVRAARMDCGDRGLRRRRRGLGWGRGAGRSSSAERLGTLSWDWKAGSSLFRARAWEWQRDAARRLRLAALATSAQAAYDVI